jgi:hypothetical protein
MPLVGADRAFADPRVVCPRCRFARKCPAQPTGPSQIQAGSARMVLCRVRLPSARRARPILIDGGDIETAAEKTEYHRRPMPLAAPVTVATCRCLAIGGLSIVQSMLRVQKREVEDVKPTEDPMDDRPQDRVVGGVGDRDRQSRAEAHAVFRSFEADAVSSPSIHSLSCVSARKVPRPRQHRAAHRRIKGVCGEKHLPRWLSLRNHRIGHFSQERGKLRGRNISGPAPRFASINR